MATSSQSRWSGTSELILMECMAMSTHVNQLVNSSFYQLWWIPAIWQSIPTFMSIQLVKSFDVLKVDYYNSLLVGLPAGQLDRIQSILNSAVQIIYGWGKYDHVMLFLRDKLQWLQVPQTVQYKCRLLLYKALNGLATLYICSYRTSIAEVQRRSTLCSVTHGNLTIPRSKTKLIFGGWSIGMKFASGQCQNCHINRHFQETS